MAQRVWRSVLSIWRLSLSVTSHVATGLGWGVRFGCLWRTTFRPREGRCRALGSYTTPDRVDFRVWRVRWNSKGRFRPCPTLQLRTYWGFWGSCAVTRFPSLLARTWALPASSLAPWLGLVAPRFLATIASLRDYASSSFGVPHLRSAQDNFI